VTNNWTSQVDLLQVTGRVFETMGGQVNFVSASTANQWGAVAHYAAHSIKGASGNLNVLNIADIAKEIELTSKENNIEKIKQLTQTHQSLPRYQHLFSRIYRKPGITHA